MYYRPQIDFKPEEVIDYLRKSQSDDPLLTVEEVLSKHEAMLDEWAEKNMGGKVPESNKYREVVSGETLKDRPEINKVLRRIENPAIKAIKCVEPQRLTRGDLEDIGRLMKLLKHTNTMVITTDGRMEKIYDLRDEYDWDAFERELKRGNEYLEYYKKIQARGRLASVAQGNYLGTFAPYGFKKTTVMDGKRKCPTLVEDPETANVVRMIFDMYVNKDMGRTSICYALDDLGIKPPKGEYWSPAAMKDMLENVHYIGKVKWNWRKTVTIVEEGEIINTRPKSKVGEFLIFDGRHKGIISEELFQAAQDKQGRRHRAKPKTKVRNPFAGLIYCKCGRAMSLRFYKNKDGSERNAPRLLCDGQTYCKSGSCLYSEMVERVAAVLKKTIEDFEGRIQNNEGDSIKLHANLIKTLEKRQKDLEAREIEQWKQQTNPDPALRMPPEVFKMLNEELLIEKEKVRQDLCNAYASMPEPVDYEEKKYLFQEALDALLDPNAPAEKVNRLLKACITKITYSKDKPERIKRTTPRKRITVDGKRKVVSDLPTGGSWTNPPIELSIDLITD